MTPRPAPRLAIAPSLTTQAFVVDTHPSKVLPSNSGVILAILARAAADSGAWLFASLAPVGDAVGGACCCAMSCTERVAVKATKQTVWRSPFIAINESIGCITGEIHREVMARNGHATRKVKAMGIKPLHARIEVQLLATCFACARGDPIEQRPTKSLRPVAGVSHEVVDVADAPPGESLEKAATSQRANLSVRFE